MEGGADNTTSIPSEVAVKSWPRFLRSVTRPHLVPLSSSTLFSATLRSSEMFLSFLSFLISIAFIIPLDSFLIYFNIGYYTEVRLKCQDKNAFILKYFGGLTGTLRCSMGYRCLGVGGWPLRPSEDTQKSCGERESYKKSINLGN